jgi:hypothetical protein
MQARLRKRTYIDRYGGVAVGAISATTAPATDHGHTVGVGGV